MLLLEVNCNWQKRIARLGQLLPEPIWNPQEVVVNSSRIVEDARGRQSNPNNQLDIRKIHEAYGSHGMSWR